MSLSVRGNVPAIHLAHLAELVSRWGVGASALFEGTGLRLGELAQPGRRLSLPLVVRVVERARVMTGEPALGVYFGLQMRISWHGYVGLAAMTARTLGDALALALRFTPTRTDVLALELRVEGGEASLCLVERAPLGSARDAILLSLVVGLQQLGCALTGRFLAGRAELAIPEPDYVARLRAMVPGDLRFGRAENRLVFDPALLALPLVTADAAASRLVLEQCERELDALGLRGAVPERVAALALRGSGGARTLADVAVELHVSERTLKRRLSEAGTSYSALLDGERRRRALELLRTTSLPLVEIAERLGYCDVASFTRAFRRLTGSTPAAARRAAAGPSLQRPQAAASAPAHSAMAQAIAAEPSLQRPQAPKRLAKVLGAKASTKKRAKRPTTQTKKKGRKR